MTSPASTVRILLIEDDEDDYLLTRDMLAEFEQTRFDLDWVTDYEFALSALNRRQHDVILLDYSLGAKSGLDFLKEAVALGCQSPIILLTGQGDRDTDVKAMEAGAADYLVKSEINAGVLERSIRYSMDRRRAEEKIRDQAHLLDLAQDAIIVCDLDGGIEYWNKGAEVMYGWAAKEATSGRTIEGFYPEPEDYTHARESLLDNEEWGGELPQFTRGGKQIVVNSRWTLVKDPFTHKPKSILIINTDITAQKRLAVQSLRAQRLESICTLSTGIAHDLNNVLSPILMAVPLLQSWVKDPHSKKLLDSIEASSKRGTELVKQVLAFAHGGEGQPVLMQVKHLVTKCAEIAARNSDPAIEVSFKVANELWPIVGDAIQLEQMIMEIVTNARDAMSGGGRLSISAENRVVEKEFSRRHADARVGSFALIEVKDTGIGISKELKKKIFDPFFTTKQSGKSGGLGLSDALDIIKSHRGFLLVDSEEGRGSNFQIFLPRADPSKLSFPHAGGSDLTTGTGERILIVDDEPSVLEAAKNTLETFGYKVDTATSGREAMEAYDPDKQAVDAVITDLRMPGMDGEELMERFREKNPNMRFIAISGSVEEQDSDTVFLSKHAAYLSKPFTPEKLLSTLYSVLTRKFD